MILFSPLLVLVLSQVIVSTNKVQFLTCIVVQNTMIIEWFRGRNMATAMGISSSVSRLGSILAFSTVAAITIYFNDYVYSMWFCRYSLLCNELT